MGKMTKTDGGPAFPVVAENGLGHVADGMSLRDWFAGQALAGMMSGGFKPNEAMDDDPEWEGQKDYKTPFALVAYRIADAMLAERNPA
jgi:hypothetical protein